MTHLPGMGMLGAAAIGGICGALGLVIALGLGAPASADSPNDNPGQVVNTGKPAGSAFYFDLRDGYDDERQWAADYVMKAEWFATNYTERNVVFDKAGMTLKLQNRRSRGQPYTGAEFQIGGFYGYGRYETIMKASDQPGVVSSFFTHTDDYFDDPHDEIDFEWLGKDPHGVQLNYFRDGKANGGKIIALPFDASREHHLYAFEWTPAAIRWFIDGELVHEVVAGRTGTPIPTASSRVIANIWAGKGSVLSWTGEPDFTTAQAHYTCMSHVPVGGAGRQCSDTYEAPPRK